MDKYLTTQQVADVFGVSKRLIQKLIAAGEISAIKVGRCLRISQSSLEEYAKRNQVRSSSCSGIPRVQYRPGDKLV